MILCDFSHLLLMLNATFGILKQIFKCTKPFSCFGIVLTGRYTEVPRIFIRLQIGVGICAALTDERVGQGTSIN